MRSSMKVPLTAECINCYAQKGQCCNDVTNHWEVHVRYRLLSHFGWNDIFYFFVHYIWIFICLKLGKNRYFGSNVTPVLCRVYCAKLIHYNKYNELYPIMIWISFVSAHIEKKHGYLERFLSFVPWDIRVNEHWQSPFFEVVPKGWQSRERLDLKVHAPLREWPGVFLGFQSQKPVSVASMVAVR